MAMGRLPPNESLNKDISVQYWLRDSGFVTLSTAAEPNLIRVFPSAIRVRLARQEREDRLDLQTRKPGWDMHMYSTGRVPNRGAIPGSWRCGMHFTRLLVSRYRSTCPQ